MSKNNSYSKGKFVPINEEKYVGKGTPIFRSSWEFRTMNYLDSNQNVIQWCSECMTIPYLFELDGKIHRYYPDFFARIKNDDETIKTYIIEVKPLKQTLEPAKPLKRTTKRLLRYKNEMFMYIKNKNKWEATEKFCKEHGFIFKIITEKSIFND